jgi:tyrosyl-tRNA synthetase
MVSVEQQIAVILKGVHTAISKDELEEKLGKSVRSGAPLNVKLGLDPSAPDIHLGHTVVLRKARQLQDLGHNVIIIIGDFTGRIGDPTGKLKGRVALSEEQVQQNAETYFQQIFKVLDRKKTEVRYNSAWLSKLTFEDVIRLASNTTVARMLERDDFQTRYLNQSPIALHEFFYPLMQAYDSIELKVDIELGGLDQTFNVLMGRNMQRAYGQAEQIALFMPLLVGLDGKEKMSKSLGNYIGVDESAEVMFKKVMELPDDLILEYYKLVTDALPSEIEIIAEQITNGVNPRDIKHRLAKTICLLYHGADEVEKALDYYEQAFGKKGIPDDIPETAIGNCTSLLEFIPTLVEMCYVKSRSEFQRLLTQSGVQLNGEKMDADDLNHPVKSGDVLKIGKKRFIRFR